MLFCCVKTIESQSSLQPWEARSEICQAQDQRHQNYCQMKSLVPRRGSYGVLQRKVRKSLYLRLMSVCLLVEFRRVWQPRHHHQRLHAPPNNTGQNHAIGYNAAGANIQDQVNRGPLVDSGLPSNQQGDRKFGKSQVIFHSLPEPQRLLAIFWKNNFP